MTIINALIEDFEKKQVLKVICGLNNFDENLIRNTIKAASLGGATYIDIAADLRIIKLAKAVSNLPICISSIIKDQIYKCVDNGIEIVEIGNFDVFYSKSMTFSVEDIKNISYKIRKQHKEITICSTIPYVLSLKEQIDLAQYLEFIGIDIIQTEGTINSTNVNKNLNLSLSKSTSTLLTAYNLSRVVNIPIIAASGISLQNSQTAMSYGASGLGVKTAIDKMASLSEKIKIVRQLKTNISNHSYVKQISKELIKL
uniref:hypothetical protein n=1 Tax=Madagascaria erythrocladioides TaxID=753684 RepID=UPI001FCD53CD|nr:hypothetical protein MW574_pgp154 [Madagascaria erythrocladioides]UNJ16513.1 hypothetical protein [Madagascaria erythrocladioides]